MAVIVCRVIARQPALPRRQHLRSHGIEQTERPNELCGEPRSRGVGSAGERLLELEIGSLMVTAMYGTPRRVPLLSECSKDADVTAGSTAARSTLHSPG